MIPAVAACFVAALIIVGDSAERLIASERGDVLEGRGFTSTADALRAGSTAVDLLSAMAAEPTVREAAELLPLLQRWAEEDAQGGQG